VRRKWELQVFESRGRSMNGMESGADSDSRTERKCCVENITLNMEIVGVSLTLLPSRDLMPSLFILTKMNTAVLTDW
jgi:hypothetical protein